MRLLPSIFALAMGLLAGLVYTYSMQAWASRRFCIPVSTACEGAE